MTPIDPLADLCQLWRDSSAISASALQARPHRRWVSRSLAMTSVAVVGIAILTLWSGWRAVQRSDWLYGLAAIAYLAAIPVLLAEFRSLARFAAEVVSAPGDLAELSRRRIALQIRLLSGARAAAIILFCVGVLACLAVTGRWLGLMWILTAILLWGWQADRGRRLAKQVARCDAIIAELEEPLEDSKSAGG